MAKKVKKKYYAIKEGKGVRDKIVTTWEECSKLVLGYKAIYKSFVSREEAESYLKGIDDTKIEKMKEQVVMGMEYKKKLKATTRMVQSRIPKELYVAFVDKCNKMKMEKDKAIMEMIREWVE